MKIKTKAISFMMALIMMMSAILPVKMTEASSSGSKTKGTVTVSVEAATIGMGYIIEPVRVSFKEGETVSHVIDRVVREQGFSYEYAGRIGASNFYFASLGDGGYLAEGCMTKGKRIHAPLDVNGKSPKRLQKVIDHRGYRFQESFYDEEEDGTAAALGEFCYSPMSGWNYAVNHVFPGVGMGAYPAKDGDVIRLQFTLVGYGADINSDAAEEEGFYDVSDKDELVKTLAYFNGNSKKNLYLKDAKVKSAYKEAVKRATDLDASAYAVEKARMGLKNAVASYQKALVKPPAKAVLTKVRSPKKKTLYAKWKKDKRADGYRVFVSRTKKFKKTVFRKNYKKNITSATIRNLKKGTYYIKVRAFRKTGKKTIYGKFSKIRKTVAK